jgi:hypothetical protein
MFQNFIHPSLLRIHLRGENSSVALAEAAAIVTASTRRLGLLVEQSVGSGLPEANGQPHQPLSACSDQLMQAAARTGITPQHHVRLLNKKIRRTYCQ